MSELLAAAAERWSRQPGGIPTSAPMPDHAIRLTGIPTRKFYHDAKSCVFALAAVSLYYDMDSLSLVNDIYNIEAEGLGQKMIYGEDSMPTIDFREPFIKTRADLKKIKTPDFERVGRFPYQLEVTRMGARLGASAGRFCAPFSLAVGLRTYPMLVHDIRKDRKFYADFMTLLVDEVLLPYILKIRDYAGVTVATGADAWSAFPNVSPDMYREFVLLYNLRVSAKAAEKGMTAVAAGCADYVEERPERFDRKILHACLDNQVATLGGAPTVVLDMGRWHEYPLETVREYTKKWRDAGVRPFVSVTINARLLRDGPVERIADTVRRYVETFGYDHNVAIDMANIPADTPPDHVHAAVAAIHTYGKLPLAGDLDRVEFTPPKRESFAEFVRKFK